MSSKILKKRSNSETVDESPPKKQKKQTIKKPEQTESKLNGDGNGPALNAAQRKREKSKIRKLAAIARIKEEGGNPKSLWANKKEKKPAAAKGENNKNRTVEEKVKAKQEKRAEIKILRKEKRQQDGQYKPDRITLTGDEIRLRITEIKGREALTKTARRKLAVFIKKLAILEGTAVNKNGADNDEEKGNLSESAKRRLRREKKGLNGDKAEAGDDLSEEENDPDKEKPVNIHLFEKKKKQKVAAKRIEQKIDDSKAAEAKLGAQKKNNKQNRGQQIAIKTNDKVVKKEIVKAKLEEDDDDEDEDEDDDSDEDESEDEVAKPENDESSDDDEEEEDDDDEEEEDDDEKEEEEEDDDEEEEEKVETVQKVVKKIEGKGKKEQKQGQGVKKESDHEQNPEKKKRYILFVGNVPFEAKEEDIKRHFLTKVGEVLSVRIPSKPGTQTPRGFGYVEVTNDIDYEKGLSLHHTMLNGRRINVEYTLSGSKKVNKRKELVAKNQKLHALRKAGKLAGSQKHDQKRSVRRFKKKEHERQTK